MDLGCGMGWFSEIMVKEGFKPVVGIDASQEMLDRAPEGLYKEKIKIVLGKDTIPDKYNNTADLMLASGILMPSHVPSSVFYDAWKMLKTGGYLVIQS